MPNIIIIKIITIKKWRLLRLLAMPAVIGLPRMLPFCCLLIGLAHVSPEAMAQAPASVPSATNKPETEQVVTKPVPLSAAQISAIVSALDVQYPAGQILADSAASTAIIATDNAKAALLQWYLVAQNACYERFFVNYCLDEAKHSDRDQLIVLQRISVEAKALQRKLRVEQLDRDLQAKRSKAEASKN